MKLFGPAMMVALVAASACSPGEKKELLTQSPPVVATQTNLQSAAPLSLTAPPPSTQGLPAGVYKLDPEHSTFLFSVSHLGFSNFTMWFDEFGADLTIDPAHPAEAILKATVNPATLMIHKPSEGFVEKIRGAEFLDATKFPAITFESVSINMHGANTAEVKGNLTMHGETKPFSLNVTFNGGYVGHFYEPRARIGFTATGSFKRSDFGMGYGVPKEGASMGTGDEVKVTINAEFLGPPMANPPAAPPG